MIYKIVLRILSGEQISRRLHLFIYCGVFVMLLLPYLCSSVAGLALFGRQTPWRVKGIMLQQVSTLVTNTHIVYRYIYQAARMALLVEPLSKFSIIRLSHLNPERQSHVCIYRTITVIPTFQCDLQVRK